MPQGKDFEEAKPFLDGDQLESPHHVCAHKCRSRSQLVVPWTVSGISWLVTIYLLLARVYPNPGSATTRGNTTSLSNDHLATTYWPTDMEAMRSSISYEQRVFTGALLYNVSSQRFYRNESGDGLEFFGPPSEAIDAAWETLLHDEWSPMTDQEAAPFRPTLTTFNGNYLFEPDMFHSLHCVNEIRKHIDSDYYTLPEHVLYTIDQEDWDRVHIDHCLDQIRQTVLCFGDLSPVPLYSWEGAPLGIGRGTEHTCRKWEPVREWADQRQLEMKNLPQP